MLKSILGIIIVVFIGCVIDIAYIKLQTTKGKLPFKIALTTNIT